MAVSQESLSVEVVLDASGAIKGLKDLNGNFVSISKAADKSTEAMNDFDRAVEGVAKSARKSGDVASKAFGSVGTALQNAFVPLTTLNQGFQLASSIIRGITQSVGGFVTAFATAEKAQLNLEKALRFVGDRVSGSADEWDRYLDVIEKTRGADADVLKGLVATSLQIGLSEKQTKNLVDASTQLANVTGRDASEAFDALLQSYKGNARALAVIAPEVRDLTEAQLQNGAAVDLVLEKYSNVESLFGKALGAQIQKTGILFDDLSESVGKAIAESIGLEGILKGLQSTFASMKSAVDAVDFERLGKQVGTFVDALILVSPALAAIALSFSVVRAQATAALVPIVIATAKLIAIAAAVAAVVAGIDILARNFTRIGDAFKALANILATGFLLVIRNIIQAVADLVGILPGMDKFAAKLEGMANKADAFADKTIDRVKKFGASLDLGIAGEVFDQGRKFLEGFNAEAGKTDDLLKNVSDKKGARGSLMDPEALKAIADEAKRAGEALLSLGEGNARLADALSLANTELANGKPLEAIEKQYRTTLLQIEAEKQKALAAGASAKAVDEQVSKAVDLANQIRDANAGLETQKAIQDAKNAAENAAEQALASLRAQRMTDNESLLRIGMSRMEVAERELRVELDKIEALEDQLRVAGKLDRFAQAELDLARRTAKEKGKNAQARIAAAPTQNEAPGIGTAVSALGSVSAGPVGAFMGAAEMITGAIQKLIDFLPNILNAVGKIFSSLADLPMVLLRAVQGVIQSLVKFTATFIPNLFKAIPEIIDQILTAAFETLPAAAQKLFEQLPQLIEGLLQRIPELVAKFVDGIISNAPTIAINLVRALIDNLPAFFKAVVLFMPRLYVAIAKGIVQGVVNAFKGVWSALKGVGTGIAAGFQDGLKRLTGFKGSVFGITEDVLAGPIDQVKNLVTEAERAGRSIWEALRDAIMKAWEWIKGVGKQIWEGLKAAVAESWEFVKSIGAVLWEGVVNSVSTIWDALKNAGKVLWQAVVDSVSTIWESLKTAGTYIWQGLKALFSGNGSEAMQAFLKAGGAIWEGFKALWNTGVSTLTSLGKIVWDSFKGLWNGGISTLGNLGTSIWDGFKAAWTNASTGFQKLINALDVGSLIGKIFKDPNPGKGRAETWLNADIPFLKFARGGFVPGASPVAGDSLRNDTVAAMLSPGEYVLPRSVTQNQELMGWIMKAIRGGVEPKAFGDTVVGKLAKGDVSGAASDAGAIAKSALDSAREAFGGLSADAKAGWDFIKSLGAQVDLVEFVKNPLAYATRVFQSAIEPFFKARLDAIMGGIFQGNAFAQGGIVPGPAGAGDVMPAMLSPGEFVLRRSAVDAIGSGTLAQMNRTGSSGQVQAGDVNVTLNIRTEQPIDEGFVRRTLVPTVKDEMRKASLRGEFILSARGVRA